MLETLNLTNENAAMLTADLLKITQEITQGKGTVGMLIRDTIMSKNLQETMNYLRITSKGTSESVASLNKLINELNRKDNVIGTLNDTVVANKMKKIVINLEKSSSEIDKVVTNLNATITNIKDGKGALNCFKRSTTSSCCKCSIRSVPNFSTQKEAKFEPYIIAFFMFSKEIFSL